MENKRRIMKKNRCRIMENRRRIMENRRRIMRNGRSCYLLPRQVADASPPLSYPSFFLLLFPSHSSRFLLGFCSVSARF